jgi:hypothetical protein
MCNKADNVLVVSSRGSMYLMESLMLACFNCTAPELVDDALADQSALGSDGTIGGPRRPYRYDEISN